MEKCVKSLSHAVVKPHDSVGKPKNLQEHARNLYNTIQNISPTGHAIQNQVGPHDWSHDTAHYAMGL